MESDIELEQYVEDYLDSNFDGEYTDVELDRLNGWINISIALEDDSGMPQMGEAIKELEEKTEMKESQIRGSYAGEEDVYRIKIADRAEFF